MDGQSPSPNGDISAAEVAPTPAAAAAALLPIPPFSEAGDGGEAGPQPHGDGVGDEDDEEETEEEDDELIDKAQRLMEKISAAPDNPSAAVLHALSSLLETQESLYVEENGNSCANTTRASHNIGRLVNLVRDNDEFFDLVSSKILAETRYSTAVRAAAARLLMSCSPTWIYPHVFDESIVENIKGWVMDETVTVSGEERNWKHGTRRREATGSEMLKAYSTGLLALCLGGGDQVSEGVLKSELPKLLMRFLGTRIAGETSTSQKDDNLKVMDERSLNYHSVDRTDDKSTGAQLSREDLADLGELPNSLRHKVGRGLTRLRGRGRTNERILDTVQGLTSPSSGSCSVNGRDPRDRQLIRILDGEKGSEAKNSSGSLIADGFTWEREENDDCFNECRIGTKDISNLVKEAVGAAEAEARAANAPPEAIKAAGDAAAEVVKSAAFEEFKSTNNDEAAVLAASIVASTVVDAANAVEVSRRATSDTNDSLDLESTETEANEETEEYFIPDVESLAQLREKYCIQCLEILGEYVDALGPILLENGVDVCLSLLERSSKQEGASNAMSLLPDVMKLICVLAAHRTFAAQFVVKHGMQKLLAVPLVEHTYFGLSSCLFTIGSIQGIMEHVCDLSSDVVRKVVKLAIQLLECSQDQARKNAALFFGAAFVFRAVIDAFDDQDGLQKSLSLLNEAASVRSGGNSGSLNLSGSASLRNNRSASEVLTSSEKQIAYHTCVALRQYFRGHFLLLVESIRPNKNRSLPRNLPTASAAKKPLELTDKAMDAIFLQLQKDRKLGPAFARARFPAVDKFLGFNGHITMLELCQAPPVERYLHDLLQYALGVLHIVTLVNVGRKMVVNATLSNNRVGIAVILDAANVIGNYVDPEIIQPALDVLINLVCPPPSISNRPPPLALGQSSGAGNIQDQSSNIPSHGDQRERNGESSAADRGGRSIGSATQASGLVGDRRISLGCAGLATQMEQGYHLARLAVRGNNGIKVLLHLLRPRIYSPPVDPDCIRALACRVLLGLARDDTFAQILSNLQVGKKLSELIRDSGSQTPGTKQSRWQAELAQVAIELIGIVTNSGRASTLAATDAATPTLRRIERAAIAAATPITYHSRELLLLIHEHLQASGLATAADALLKDAQLTPLPSSLAPQDSIPETSSVQIEWPSGRAPSGFLSEKSKATVRNGSRNIRCDSSVSAKKKHLLFSPSFGSQSRSQPQLIDSKKSFSSSKQYQLPSDMLEKEALSESVSKNNFEKEPLWKTPAKRKLSDLKDIGLASSGKRLNTSEHGFRTPVCSTPANARKICDGLTNTRDIHTRSTPFSAIDYIDENPCPSSAKLTDISSNSDRLTLDSIVVQYLKQQHRQCSAPITTLPPLSLLQPHVCPEPKRCLDAPSNVTARIGSRQFSSLYSGVHGNRKDRQFVCSRFRPWRTCRDDTGALLTCMTFLGNSSHVAVGSHNGELKIFDSNSSNLLESCASHQAPLTLVQSHLAGQTQLVLSSSSQDVCLWDASSISGGPMHTLEGRKAARFSNSGDTFATLTTDVSRREILLYDVQTCQVVSTLSDMKPRCKSRGHVYPPIHFSPSDSRLLWDGVLWDRSQPDPIHRFDQFTDYGGGGFHPSRNEVIINSEVWDLRNFRLLRSVPSLDQTTITFNARGDVIYAILRRNLEDVMAAVHSRRVKHPLFAAFRTVDAINYSEIATVPVDRCVLDFALEPTDSFLGLITMDDQDEMFSSARVYEIGRRRPADDDSDPDDAESEVDDEDEDDDDDDDVDPRLDFGGSDGDSDADGLSNDDDDDDDDSDDSATDDEDDGDFMEFGGGGGGIPEMEAEGDEEDDGDDDDDDDDDDSQVLELYGSGEDDFMS